jgi:hypothetical protein
MTGSLKMVKASFLAVTEGKGKVKFFLCMPKWMDCSGHPHALATLPVEEVSPLPVE